MASLRVLARLLLLAVRKNRYEHVHAAADRFKPRAVAVTKRAFAKAKASIPQPTLELALNAGDTERVMSLVDAALKRFESQFRKPFTKVMSEVQGEAGAAAAKKLSQQLRVSAFNPDQPRDESGKFAPVGGGDPGSTSGSTREALGRRFPTAGQTVDGRTVRTKIPNESSIDASLTDYEILPGIREIHMSEMDPSYSGQSYSATENERIDRLAEQITESGEINPLIVVVDKHKHPYILEGGHRYDALIRLKAKSFPARVVIDTSEVDLKDLVQFRSAAPKIKGFAFDRTNPQAREWVDEHVGELIDDMSRATRERVKDLVERTVDGEFDTHDLADRITELIGDESRAETIARTETMAASNGGQREAWAQAVDDGLLNGDEEEEWITTPDDVTCPICRPMDGERKPLGGKFNVDGEQMDGPPAHPRCRCTTALAIKT